MEYCVEKIILFNGLFLYVPLRGILVVKYMMTFTATSFTACHDTIIGM